MAGTESPHTANRTLQGVPERGRTSTGGEVARRAVGYIRVSTDRQAADGLSLDAQQAAIERFCAAPDLKR